MPGASSGTGCGGPNARLRPAGRPAPAGVKASSCSARSSGNGADRPVGPGQVPAVHQGLDRPDVQGADAGHRAGQDRHDLLQDAGLAERVDQLRAGVAVPGHQVVAGRDGLRRRPGLLQRGAVAGWRRTRSCRRPGGSPSRRRSSRGTGSACPTGLRPRSRRSGRRSGPGPGPARPTGPPVMPGASWRSDVATSAPGAGRSWMIGVSRPVAWYSATRSRHCSSGPWITRSSTTSSGRASSAPAPVAGGPRLQHRAPAARRGRATRGTPRRPARSGRRPPPGGRWPGHVGVGRSGRRRPGRSARSPSPATSRTRGTSSGASQLVITASASRPRA